MLLGFAGRSRIEIKSTIVSHEDIRLKTCFSGIFNRFLAFPRTTLVIGPYKSYNDCVEAIRNSSSFLMIVFRSSNLPTGRLRRPFDTMARSCRTSIEDQRSAFRYHDLVVRAGIGNSKTECPMYAYRTMKSTRRLDTVGWPHRATTSTQSLEWLLKAEG